MAAQKEDLAKIVGPQNVLDDADVIESHSRDESFVHPLRPRFVVKPQNASAVQELVQWANQGLTPLVPLSSGPPHFRGDSLPSVPGAVVVDLSSMKKIVHIDKRNRMVLIEPGVTYPQLQPELARAGLKLSTPLLPRSTKSVLAALLEREPVLTPRLQWSALEPLRALEVTWGDGQKMTTGDAGGTDQLEEEWKKGFAQIVGSGPAQTDFYKVTSAAQGSMGIVTWASVKCEVLPRVHKLFLAGSNQLESLIDLCYEVLRIRFADELFLLNNWNLANILEKDPQAIRKLAAGLPSWVVAVGIAGRDRFPAERVDYQAKDISDLARKHGLELLPDLAGVAGQKLLDAILKPASDPYWKLNYKGAFQDIFFLTTLDKTPKFIQAMQSVAAGQSYPVSEIGVYLQPVQQGASCHLEFNFPFLRTNSRELARMQQLFTQGSLEMLNQGAYYSRPYGSWSELAFNRDYRSTQVLGKIKDIFDPNHIMNPGKLCF